MVIAIVVFAVIVLFWSLTICGANQDKNEYCAYCGEKIPEGGECEKCKKEKENA